MVKYHMRPTQIGYPPSRKAIYRYFRDTGDTGIETLFLSLADHLATRGPGLLHDNWREHCDNIKFIVEEQCRQQIIVKPAWLIDGNDLISILGMQPGAILGKILDKVHEAQASGEITSREEALDYTRYLLSTGRNK